MAEIAADNVRNQRVVPFLSFALARVGVKDPTVAGRIEARMHNHAATPNEYRDTLLQMTHNLQHPSFHMPTAVDLSSSGQVMKALLTFRPVRKGANVTQYMKKYQSIVVAMDAKKQENQDEGFLRCYCGSFDVTWASVQTRSADEGATVVCDCNVCGKNWRVSN